MNTPILLITFNRPNHTRRTLEALMAQSPREVYVFQDGARSSHDGDKINCPLVREVIDEFVHRYSNCIFHTHYSEQNRGCRDAIIFAISSVLKEHESIIVVEDDIITSPAFLSYMNKALDYYKDCKTVHSVSGYSPSPSHFTIPKSYDYDVYASPRLFGWGWGTWRDRWEKVDWSMSYYEDFMKHPEEIKAFNRGGDDMVRMLVDEKMGRSSAWDVQFVFDQFKKHMVSIVPTISYTANIGCDGSGTHCNAYSVNVGYDKLNKKSDVKLLDNLYFDSEIINRLHSVFVYKKRPIWQKACNWIARKLECEVPYQVKSAVYAR